MFNRSAVKSVDRETMYCLFPCSHYTPCTLKMQVFFINFFVWHTFLSKNNISVYFLCALYPMIVKTNAQIIHEPSETIGDVPIISPLGEIPAVTPFQT